MIDIIVAVISTVCAGYQSRNNFDNWPVCLSVLASSHGIQQIAINQLTLLDSALSPDARILVSVA